MRSLTHSSDPEAKLYQGNHRRRMFPSSSNTEWLGLFLDPVPCTLTDLPITAPLKLWPDDDCAECLDTHPWPGTLLFCGTCCQGIHNNADIISITPRGKGGIQSGGRKTRDPGWLSETHSWQEGQFPHFVLKTHLIPICSRLDFQRQNQFKNLNCSCCTVRAAFV